MKFLKFLSRYVDLSDLVDRPEALIQDNATHLPHPKFRPRTQRAPADGRFEDVDDLEPDFSTMDAPVAIPYSMLPTQTRIKRSDDGWIIE